MHLEQTVILYTKHLLPNSQRCPVCFPLFCLCSKIPTWKDWVSYGERQFDLLIPLGLSALKILSKYRMRINILVQMKVQKRTNLLRFRFQLPRYYHEKNWEHKLRCTHMDSAFLNAACDKISIRHVVLVFCSTKFL